MLGKTIMVRCKGYGWCIGKIIKKVTRGLANFIAKFEVDDEPSTCHTGVLRLYVTPHLTPSTMPG